MDLQIMSKWKRGSSNVIATMLIFGLMITSMGVLYSRIAPTLFGFDSKSKSTNQEFVFLMLANSMQELAGSAENSQGRVHIISKQATYSLNDYISIQTKVNDSGGILNGSGLVDIGAFFANVSGSYETQSKPSYLNQGASENTIMSGDYTGSSSNYVSKVSYTKDSADFTLYFNVMINMINTNSTNYILTITFIKIVYDTFADGKAIDFPVSMDEWTLRLKRQASNTTKTPPYDINGNESISIIDNIGGKTNIPGPANDWTLTIKFIEISIKFGL